MFEKIQNLANERKYSLIREMLIKEKPADAALVIENLKDESRASVFRILPKSTAAEVFAYIDSDIQEELINQFTNKELNDILENLFVDDVVDIIEEMPSNVVKKILNSANASTRKSINEILQYPKDSAGSIMTTEYVSLKADMTVVDAFLKIRRTGVNKETIYTCYVTSDDRKLIGIVSAKTLMLSDEDKIMSQIMDDNFKYVTTNVDRETVAEMFRKYDLLALPVVDFEGRLVGIVTVDDAIDVLSQEATEDMEAMAAIVPTDKPYIKTGVIETFLKRVPWLLILMISAAFTGAVINSYQKQLSGYVALTAFIPMLMGTGGNCGSQTSVSVIRSLSLGEINIKDIFKVIWKEVRVAVLCGLVLAIANFLKLYFIDRISIMACTVVSLTLIATVIVAKLIGCILPIVAKSIKLDPAVMASPFITTIVDAVSLLVYFNIATILLKL